MRREFDLGAEDARALDALGHSWETIRSAGGLWILIDEYPLPPGYNVPAATLALRTDTYPSGMIDMAYFQPLLARADGKLINNLSTLTIDNKTFQQWSRHYSWNPALHSLSTHIRRVGGWLRHEFRKR
jgi:hypothetical protein